MRYLSLLAALVLSLVACGSPTPLVLPPAGCTVGRVEVCACPGGATGAQACTDAGSFGACVCSSGDAGPDAGDAAGDVLGLDVAVGDAAGDAAADASADGAVDTGVFDTPNGCAPLENRCELRCVNLRNDPSNCGRCGGLCEEGWTCDGVCRAPVDAGAD